MYLETYNFSSRPFQLTPDLRFLFPSRSHKRALSYLRFGMEQSEGFVVITGHIGTGKTMLIQTLLAEMADQEVATAKIAAANLNEENILSAVASALNLPYEGRSKVAIMTNLEKSLRHARDRLSGVLLIVDEAQTLTPEALEELRILSNLECQGRALMQIFLVGQTELRVTLQARRMEQLRQRIVASYHLEPMSPEETKRYIGFRLVAVGWNGDPSFSAEVYESIYKSTGGIPRKVNIVMDRLLLFGYLEDIRDFEGEHIEQVITEMKQELSGDLVTVVEDKVETEGQPRSRSELEERLRQLESRLEDLVGATGAG